MASIVTSFQSLAQLDTAVAAIDQGYSLDNALTWAQAAFDRAYDLTPSSYTISTSTQVSVRYSNGDSATFLGSNLTSSTPFASQLSYQFSGGTSVVLKGAVSESASGVLSGNLTQATVSKSGLGSITINGNTDVAGTGGTISKVTWDVSGAHLEENGSMTASIWVSGGTYNASHSGTTTSGLLTYGGKSFQVSGLSLDGNAVITNAASFLQTILAGNDTITGSGSSVSLWGYAGADTLVGTSGNDTLDGGSGLDTASYSSAHTNYSLTKAASGYTVTSATSGTDTLANVERIQFSDGVVALDVDPWATAGEAYRLYRAAFARTPDNGGLKYWISQMDTGQTNEQVAHNFIVSAEFQSLYGTSPTHSQLVNAMYQNVLNRAPDQGGFDYWKGLLDNNQITPEQLLINFSESNENVAVVGVAINSGIWLT